ncbi:IS3 family transposase [Sporosarcina sp. FSL W7-1283]|uniref:IS3 family transposase n=1 Tax=Sporosarcina sp. FSL W7-1283 TaxID=2921560 RepID=UPI0040468E3B
MFSFFGTGEVLWRGASLRTYKKIKRDIDSYLNYHNNERIKQKMVGMSPVQYRFHTSQLAF